MRQSAAQNEQAILSMLAIKPATAADIATMLNVTRSLASRYLRNLQTASPRRVHIAGWARTGGRAFQLFGIGDLPDVEFVRFRSRNKGKPADPYKAQCAGMLDAMATPQTVDDLVERLRVSPSYVRKFIRIMRERKLIHIADWRHPEAQGAMSAMYQAGCLPDKKKKTRSATERRKLAMADTEKYDLELARRRARWLIRRHAARSQPATWFSALGAV